MSKTLPKPPVIRCPICTEPFTGHLKSYEAAALREANLTCQDIKLKNAEFQAFFEKHKTCKGQSLGDCGCTWERLCDGSTLLARADDACPECAERYPDGSAAVCKGCPECSPNPLTIQVDAGLHDDRLLAILEDLDNAEKVSARGLSPHELNLRHRVYSRLDVTTRPA